MKELHILNLGAGWQSTTLYLMSFHQHEPDFVPRFDYAIFADTQEEPQAVYSHLEWLKSLNDPPILIGTVGKLGEDLICGVNYKGQRFASIPAFTSAIEGQMGGMTKRQCTGDYKVKVVERTIRREIVGLAPNQRFPKDKVKVYQYFGLSYDEAGRIVSTRARIQATGWSEPRFPLYDLEMTRFGCGEYLKTHCPHPVPRSACVFCPFRSNAEWRELRDNHPDDWQRAIEVDEGMRREGVRCNRGLDQKLYVHRSCVPLARAKIDTQESLGLQRSLFDMECEGMCGL